ncbi:hypothetical protein NLJ89_g7162 [Agrocybe chaxingu]|uniref:DUF4336 domain-containing protein n=1 Tax=Agrocybe chaxingu TaxID=84603 RepID=A0A9W8MVB4_9AGAR|nr:hypothetical protein NLJ89_g7162 [Agrocybe chaxingu]
MSDETVIREVYGPSRSPSLDLASGPLGGRSTAVQLRDGGVWLLASTPLTAETKAKLNELGPVKYIIGADAVHHLFLGEYKNAYQSAKLIAPVDAIARHGDATLQFDGETKYGFEDEIEHCYFTGFKNKDVAFLHRSSKSLIEADLLLNLPAKEQYSKTKEASTLLFGFGGFGPFSWVHRKFMGGLAVDQEAMRRDAKIVSGWDFNRIIPCHGDVIEGDGKKAWNELYKDFLE